MKNFDNYYDGVSMLLDKIADKLDPDFPNGRPENYSDSVVESLERIAENFDPSDGRLPAVTSSDNGKSLVVEDGEWAVDEIGGGAGVVEVYNYSGYMTKEKKSGTSYRYTKKEFSDLLNENSFVVWKTSVDNNMYYAFAIIWRPAPAVTDASVIAIEQNGNCAVYYGTISLSGTQTGSVSAPTLYTKVSGGGVLTISENSETTATEAMAAIENGYLIRLEMYGVYYPCLYYTVNQDETTYVELQCGPYNVSVYEDPSYNSFNNLGWPTNDNGGGSGGVDDGGF